MRIFIWDIFSLSLLVNKEIEGECCPKLEPPHIVKVMHFVCEICNEKNVEVLNSLET